MCTQIKTRDDQCVEDMSPLCVQDMSPSACKQRKGPLTKPKTLVWSSLFQLQHSIQRLALLLHDHFSCPQEQHPQLQPLSLGVIPTGALMPIVELPTGHELNYPGASLQPSSSTCHAFSVNHPTAQRCHYLMSFEPQKTKYVAFSPIEYKEQTRNDRLLVFRNKCQASNFFEFRKWIFEETIFRDKKEVPSQSSIEHYKQKFNPLPTCLHFSGVFIQLFFDSILLQSLLSSGNFVTCYHLPIHNGLGKPL